TLVGRVTNDGPVDGMDVQILRRAGTGEPILIDTVTTNADGSFEYEPPVADMLGLLDDQDSVIVTFSAIALERTPLMLPSDAPTASDEVTFEMTFVKNVA